jgi:DNA-binding response OmpR family regulator
VSEKKQKRALVIEDSKIISKIVQREMRRLGYAIDQAYTLGEARKYLESGEYDLLILDLHLPDGEGFDLIADVQFMTQHSKGSKVVVLTSSKDEDLRDELFRFGILDYIIKDTNLVYAISEVVKTIKAVETRQKEKIFVIDDSKFICNQVRKILEPRNYEVAYALNAKEGLARLKEEGTSLLVLDMELPDMHGLEVLEHIRKDPQLRSLPVVVLSGRATPDVIREALKNGASDFMKKPFVFEEFVLKVDLWIDYCNKGKELEEKSEALRKMNENLQQLVEEEVEKNRVKERLLFMQSRHAQMGEMIAMIAHQWRQPLNAIGSAVSLMRQKIRMGRFDEQMAEDIAMKIQRYVEYLSETIDDFRNFFKPDNEKSVTDFDTITRKALDLTGDSLASRGISIRKEIGRADTFVAYENELVQVVINLLKNAEDVLVERRVEKPTITIAIDGDKLQVRDNGGGIEDEVIERIFDPYFSTKSKKEGTGLGLYMVKLIVEEHCGGRVSVRNVDGGAEFTIDMGEAGV